MKNTLIGILAGALLTCSPKNSNLKINSPNCLIENYNNSYVQRVSKICDLDNDGKVDYISQIDIYLEEDPNHKYNRVFYVDTDANIYATIFPVNNPSCPEKKYYVKPRFVDDKCLWNSIEAEMLQKYYQPFIEEFNKNGEL
jgi:hypothetical protein